MKASDFGGLVADGSRYGKTESKQRRMDMFSVMFQKSVQTLTRGRPKLFQSFRSDYFAVLNNLPKSIYFDVYLG